jgi:tellurium resistance protein TerD
LCDVSSTHLSHITLFFILIGFAAVGLVWAVVSGIVEGIKAPPKVPLTPEQQRAKDEVEQVRCPRCQSAQITANNKGFGVGKAAAGGLLLGPVGLLGGFIGSGKVKVTCLKCGHTWKP